MPEKITAYRCKYRCGERASIKKETIENHEYNCFSNPRRKACKTCALQGFDSEFGYFCSEDHLKKDKFATYDCEHWELKE